jgi:hypothetical protein
MTKVIFRENAMQRLEKSQDGAIGRYLIRQGRLIEAGARRQVGVRTGALRASIHLRHFADPRGQFVRIGSDLSYARLHHEGSKPHLIVPKQKGGLLKFQTKGRTVFTHMVRHPGTPPNRYLTDNMRRIIR